MSPTPPGRPHLVLVGLFLAFALPALLAWFMYLRMADEGSASSTVRGTLIQPTRPLPLVPLERVAGREGEAPTLSRLWSLVYVHAAPCDAPCRERLVELRQVRLALNEDQRRVQRLWFLAGPEAPDWSPELTLEQPDLVAARPSDPALARAFAVEPGAGPQPGTYIVDPLGNLVLYYGADAPPKGILKDLQRLLKLSRIG